MKSIALRLLLLLNVCAFLTPLANADDSQVFDTGKNVYPINNDNIRMVSEKVTIYRKTIPENNYRASIDCEFIFENMTNEVQTVKIGFPGIACERPTPLCNPGLINFISYVDGEEVPVTIREEITDVYNLYGIEKGDRPILPTDYIRRNWYTWDATFPPSSRLKLRNTYEIKLSGDSGGLHWYKYILVTGANWKGPIGRAAITVIYEDEDFFRRKVGKIKPGGYKIQGNKIIWELKDFTPQEDIEILEISDWFILNEYMNQIEGHFEMKEYEGSKRLYKHDDLKNPIALDEGLSSSPLISGDIMKDELDRIYAKILRREICARNGGHETGYGLYQFHSKQNVPWGEDYPNCSEDLLSNIEKQNIKFLEVYERERGWR